MHHDAIIIGGGFAGLSAATYVARARRSVRVVDAGRPRNRFAARSHGFLGHDGAPPASILSAARAQLAAYPSASIIEGEAITAERTNRGFAVGLAGGEVLEATAVVLAFGLRDELPDVPGLAERWGRSVLHCPYCHGHEFAGRRLGVLATSPMSAHQAMLIPEWGPTTLFLNGALEPDADTLAELGRRGVAIEDTRVAAVHGEGDTLSAVELADGRRVAIDALYTAPRTHFNSPVAEQLGCATEDTPVGRVIRTDGFKTTSVPSVFAAGDIARPMHSVALACADGVIAGVALHRSLVFPE